MSDAQTTLHIRLDEQSLQALKHRARLRRTSLTSYAASILRYLTLLDEPNHTVHATQFNNTPELYVATPLPPLLRQRLVSQSVNCPCSLATFAGLWIGHYLERFEQDPGDLNMMCHLGELLERKPVLSEIDLEAIIQLAADSAIARMPTAYQVGWYHARLRPLLSMVEWQGRTISFAPEHVATILTRLKR
jgi:hypothetical protein